MLNNNSHSIFLFYSCVFKMCELNISFVGDVYRVRSFYKQAERLFQQNRTEGLAEGGRRNKMFR
jgi:hypothetical protein